MWGNGSVPRFRVEWTDLVDLNLIPLMCDSDFDVNLCCLLTHS